jgi:hypothetical protein
VPVVAAPVVAAPVVAPVAAPVASAPARPITRPARQTDVGESAASAEVSEAGATDIPDLAAGTEVREAGASTHASEAAAATEVREAAAATHPSEATASTEAAEATAASTESAEATAAATESAETAAASTEAATACFRGVHHNHGRNPTSYDGSCNMLECEHLILLLLFAGPLRADVKIRLSSSSGCATPRRAGTCRSRKAGIDRTETSPAAHQEKLLSGSENILTFAYIIFRERNLSVSYAT